MIFCSQKGQFSADTKLSNVSGTLFHIYFDPQTGEIPKSFRNLKLFEFFVDCSNIDAKLFFCKPLGTVCNQNVLYGKFYPA